MHRATESFWQRYHQLPPDVRVQADKSFGLLRSNSSHPSLRFKKVGAFWSARIDLRHRALAIEEDGDFTWVWIGSHDAYEQMVRKT